MTYSLSFRAIVWLSLIALVINLMLSAPVSILLVHLFAGSLPAWLQSGGEGLAGLLFAITAFFLLAPFSIAFATVLVDLMNPDHTTSYFFRTTERPISLQARLTRNMILIVYPQLLVMMVMGLLLLQAGTEISFEQAGPLAILLSASLATAGWLYSSYFSALSARQSTTVKYLADLNADSRHRDYAVILKKFIAEASGTQTDRLAEFVFSADQVEGLMRSGHEISYGERSASFRETCRYFLAHLEHLSLSVRTGIFDQEILQRQKRRRLIWYYNALIQVIIRQSHARPDDRERARRARFETATIIKRDYKKWRDRRARRGRAPCEYKRGNDTWENFIWLIMEMDGPNRISSDVRADIWIDPRRLRRPTEAVASDEFEQVFKLDRDVSDI